jgi:hypothetical protein
MKAKSAVAFVLIAVFAVSSVAVLAPMTVYAKPPPRLNKRLCETMQGLWYAKGKTCTLSDSYTVTSSFMIPFHDTLAIGAGTFTIQSGVTITNYGTIYNYGTIDIHLGGTLNDDGEIQNHGTISLYFSSDQLTVGSGGVLGNHGTVSSNGYIANYGTIDNYEGATLTQSYDFYNYGTLINHGTLIIGGEGEIYNNGYFYNCGTYTNSGHYTGAAVINSCPS